MPYPDDLTLASETLEGLKRRLEAWKRVLESKGLRVNFRRMKIMINKENTRKVTMGDKFPCTVSRH